MSDTEQEINANVSDADLLADALGGGSTEAVTQEAEVTEQPVTQDRARDEQGRFARKEEQAATEAKTEAQAEAQREDAHVPSWRLREVSEARRAAEKRAEDNERKLRELEGLIQQFQRQQPQNQPAVADLLFEKPEEAIGQVVSPLVQRAEQRAAQAETRAAKIEAILEYSRDEVAAAEKAFNEAAESGQMDRNEWARIQQSPNPFAAAVEWHKRNTVLSEVGTDPNAWLEKKLEESLNDPAFLAKAIERVRGGGNAAQSGAAPNTVTRLPPSLNKAVGSATRNAEEFDNSDKGLLSTFLPR